MVTVTNKLTYLIHVLLHIYLVRFKLTKFLFSFISLKASSKLTEEQIEGKQIQIF